MLPEDPQGIKFIYFSTVDFNFSDYFRVEVLAPAPMGKGRVL